MIHIRNRIASPRLLYALIRFAPVIGALAGLAIGAVFVVMWGANPWQFAVELARGAFGDPTKIGATLNRTTPLLIAGVGTAIAFRAGAFNVGQEGQLHIGAIGGVLVGFAAGALPGIIGLPFLYLGSMIAGAAFAGIAILLYLKRGVHEVLSTLLLNFVGVFFTAYLVSDPIRDKSGLNIGHPQTALMPPSLHLPVWRELGFTHLGIIVGILIALGAAYLLSYTPLGFRIRMSGLSPEAARAAGVRPERIFTLGMLISGALSGLAGAVGVTGIYHRLLFGFAEGLGFDSLAVTLLAGSNPIAVIPSALFFGVLRAGSLSMQRGIGVPSVVLYVIRGAIILFVLIGIALSKNKAVQKRLRAYEMERMDVQAGSPSLAAGNEKLINE
jgi:simple sugar transport system permease protein